MNVPADPSRRILDRVTVARRRAEQLATFLSQAEQAAQVGDVDAAIAACEEVLILDPDNEAAARLVDRVKDAHDGREPGHAGISGASPHHVLRSDESGDIDRAAHAPADVASDGRRSEFLTELANSEAPVHSEGPSESLRAPDDSAHLYTPPFLSPAIPEPSVALDLFSSESDLSAQNEIVLTADAALLPPSNPQDDFRLPPAAPQGAGVVVTSTRRALSPAPTGEGPARPIPPNAPWMTRLSPMLEPARRLLDHLPLPSGWSSAWTAGAAMLLVFAIGSVWALLRLPRAGVSVRATTSRLDVRAPTPDVAVSTLPSPPPTDAGPPRADRESGRRLAPVASPTSTAPPVTPAREVDLSATIVPTAVATSGTFASSAPPRSSDSPRPEPSAVETEPVRATAPPSAPPSATTGTPEFTARVQDASPTPVASAPAAPISTPAVRVDDAPVLRVDDRADARERYTVAGRESPAAAVPEVVAAPVPTGLDDERAVRDAVRAYTSAYSGLDVEAVKAVFPGVNDTALRRAFRSLRSQQVELRGAAVSVSGDAALVSGTWVSSAIGQVGGSAPQRDERPVVFTLVKQNGAWVILSRR